ncbi:Uncharacterized protein FKW44_017803, partial [Caligus rogercresseyi]
IMPRIYSKVFIDTTKNPEGEMRSTITNNDLYCQRPFKRFSLLEDWRSRILKSLSAINDGEKFMDQLKISAVCISFNFHYLNYGKLYNDVERAFVDCPFVIILTKFLTINAKGFKTSYNKYTKATILFGLLK